MEVVRQNREVQACLSGHRFMHGGPPEETRPGRRCPVPRPCHVAMAGAPVLHVFSCNSRAAAAERASMPGCLSCL